MAGVGGDGGVVVGEGVGEEDGAVEGVGRGRVDEVGGEESGEDDEWVHPCVLE